MFDEEAERLKLSVLDLTEDVVEMILKKKRAKHDAALPTAGGDAPLRPPTASEIAKEEQVLPEPSPPQPVAELQEEEPVISPQPVAKKYFHMWHRKLYSA